MTPINVRYIVNDVDEAIQFYEAHLGFDTVMHPAPGFAALERDGLTLFLNAPGAGGAGIAGTTAEDSPRPGGWARFQLIVDDLEALVADLTAGGVKLRGTIAHGVAGDQAVIEDPSGNPIELFQPYETREDS